MSPYIQNLTDQLAKKNKYLSFGWGRTHDEFLRHVKQDLSIDDVGKMNPATLGRIMCSFEIGDVMATRKELFDRVLFSGDCEDLLRELVSLCLAYVIYDKLFPGKHQPLG